MELRLITVAFDPETGCFPERPLKDIEGEVVNVVEHFFHHAEQPHLLLIAHVRTRVEARKRSRPEHGSGPRDTLNPAEVELYDRLRTWRNGCAHTEGVPPYVILTNQQLAEVARRRPETKTALREIHGVGEAKATRYGGRILQVVAHPVPQAGAQQGSEPTPRQGTEPAARQGTESEPKSAPGQSQGGGEQHGA